MQWAKQKNGFTIVELLIVVVVIAILAAITIVAYNGITSRARDSAMQSALSQVNKKLATYSIQNSNTYPAQLTDAGISENGGTTFQYAYDNNVNPATYCVTATNSTVNFKINSIDGKPVSGACAGHGSGGVAAITNLVPNPSFETNAAGWGYTSGNGGVSVISVETSGGYSGNNFHRMKWTTAPTVNWGGSVSPNMPVSVGSSYSASVWVRSNKAYQIYLILRPNNYPTGPDQTGPATTLVPNTWVKLTSTFNNVASGTAALSMVMSRTGSGTWLVNDTFDTDGAIFVTGTTPPNFADGNTNNWVWNGTPANNVTSTGPPA